MARKLRPGYDTKTNKEVLLGYTSETVPTTNTRARWKSAAEIVPHFHQILALRSALKQRTGALRGIADEY